MWFDSSTTMIFNFTAKFFTRKHRANSKWLPFLQIFIFRKMYDTVLSRLVLIVGKVEWMNFKAISSLIFPYSILICQGGAHPPTRLANSFSPPGPSITSLVKLSPHLSWNYERLLCVLKKFFNLCSLATLILKCNYLFVTMAFLFTHLVFSWLITMPGT